MPDLIKCPKCAEQNEAQRIYCWVCYTSLEGIAPQPVLPAVTSSKKIYGQKKEIEPKKDLGEMPKRVHKDSAFEAAIVATIALVFVIFGLPFLMCGGAALFQSIFSHR